jgi:hypothetical protein
MLKMLHANGIRAAVFERLDRLARDLMVQEVALCSFQQHASPSSRHGAGPYANDPSRIAFRQMMGVFAQYDKSMVVLRLAGARPRAVKALRGPEALRAVPRQGSGTGVHPGPQEKRFRVRPHRRALNAEGIPSRTGGRFTALWATGS